MATIEEEVINIIADQLGKEPSEITLDSKLVGDLGADSLDIATLIMELESKYKTEIPDEDAEELVSVRKIVDYVKVKTGYTNSQQNQS